MQSRRSGAFLQYLAWLDNVHGQNRWFIPWDPNPSPTTRNLVPVLAIGAWYRQLLGIEGRDSSSKRLLDAELDIRDFKRSMWSLRRWWAAIRVTQQHPVSTNRIAMNLALLSLALGIVSLIIPFL